MREKQRAKDEVNRLNGVVSGPTSAGGPNQEHQSSSSAAGAPWRRRPIFHPPANDARQVTPAERKRQLAQLAEMGVAVPEEFRGDLAMAGDWQVVSERVIHDDEGGVKTEENDERDGGSNVERKYAAAEGSSIGVRKRKYQGQEEEGGGEEEDEAGEVMAAPRGWGLGSGSRLHTYPAGSRGGEEDLDSLLTKTKVRIKDERDGAGSNSQPPPLPPIDRAQQDIDTVPTTQNPDPNPPIKQEADADETKPLLPLVSGSGSLSKHNNDLKQDPDTPLEQASGIVFKKRKAKPIRNR